MEYWCTQGVHEMYRAVGRAFVNTPDFQGLPAHHQHAWAVQHMHHPRTMVPPHTCAGCWEAAPHACWLRRCP